jgi:hypothetical protein
VGSSIERSSDQVLEHLDVSRLHDIGLYDNAEDLLLSVHFYGYTAASRRSVDDHVLHFFLQLLGLLSRLRQHFLQIESAHECSENSFIVAIVPPAQAGSILRLTLRRGAEAPHYPTAT